MADLVFIGLGRVGSLALDLLLRLYPGLSVRVVDCVDKSWVTESYGVEFHRACTPSEIAGLCRGAYVVATALPSSVAVGVVEELFKRGYSVVDVSYIDVDPYVFQELCIRSKTYYIPDAGFAPGFSNLVVGYIYSRIGELDRVAIYVGGIPVEPVPPIGYQVTWSPEDLIEEYTRSARIVRDYSVVSVDPLKEILSVEIPGLGVFEGFYSDGLHTLLRNIKAREMYEVTIRYKGHLEAMKILRSLGFFDDKPVSVDGYMVSPKRFTACLFREKLRQTIPDQAILYIVVEKKNLYYRLLSRLVGSLEKPATPYYTALVYTKTIAVALEEDIEPGVHPLEKLHRYYQSYRSYLVEHGVEFNVSSNISTL